MTAFTLYGLYGEAVVVSDYLGDGGYGNLRLALSGGSDDTIDDFVYLLAGNVSFLQSAANDDGEDDTFEFPYVGSDTGSDVVYLFFG